MLRAAADTLGADGVYVDPLWRITVILTPLERELLRRWSVRRLGFIAHAGAAVTTTTQSYSRLEHSLGLLALVAHFRPGDDLTRASALVHDIGHLPFSHTFENVAGLNHHTLGASRVDELGDLFRSHGIDPADVTAIERGERVSPLHGRTGLLRLDHLDSFVRSGRSHGRTRESPPSTLSRLRLVDGAVDTDQETADYLLELIIGEARLHSSAPNVAATGVMRRSATEVLSDMTSAQQLHVAAMTDDQFWGVLLTDPRTAKVADDFRRDPGAWRVTEIPAVADRDGRPGSLTDFEFQIDRLYLDLPLVDGMPFPPASEQLGELPRPPLRYRISRDDATGRP